MVANPQVTRIVVPPSWCAPAPDVLSSVVVRDHSAAPLLPCADNVAIAVKQRITQPKRIPEADRVVAGVGIEIDAPRQPAGILGEQGP